MLLRASQLDADEEKRKRKENELLFDLHRFTDTVGDINTMPYSSMVDAYGEEVAQIWKDFTIEDPYSVIFGFLYLLDQNYDLPWAYQGSVALVTLASNTLPWRYGDYEGEKEGIWAHYDDTVQDYVWGYEKARLPKRIKLTEMEERIASERQELTDLRELVFHQQEEVYYEDTEVSEISFPYNAAKRIVVFGGHDSWAREIKQKLPNVRFIDRTMQPNAELIRRADVVWIQTNSLSHSYYYKIIDEVRKHHVPVRYFSYASATKCAEQIVEEDQRVM